MWAGLVARFRRSDRQLWGYVAVTAVLVWALLWHLGSATAGFSPTDKTAILASQNHHTLFSSFINDWHNSFLYALQHFGVKYIYAWHLVSVVFGAIFIWCFYAICRSWFGRFIAALTTAMFATTPLVLLSARVIEPAIMYLSLAPVVYLYLTLMRTEDDSRIVLWLLAAASALALYTPGYAWVLLLLLLFGRRRLSAKMASLPNSQIVIACLIFVALVAPLGWSLVTNTHQARTWLWLGPNLTHPIRLLKDLAWSLSSLFWQSGSHHELQVNKLAVLNLAQVVLAAIGLYGLWQKARDKAIGFGGLVIVAIVGATINSDYNVLLIAVLPLMILAAAGLRFLLLEWQSIFPRNPLPRGLAIVLICLLAAFSCAYGLRYSLAAWPHTLATRQTYVLK